MDRRHRAISVKRSFLYRATILVPCDIEMVEMFGVSAMIVMVFLALAAVYILMKFFEEKERTNNVVLQPPVANPVQTLPLEEEFIYTFTRPMLQDGAAMMDDAVESIKLGCSHYEHDAFVEASDEFHGAVRSLDDAADKLKEVLNDVENQASPPALKARKLLDDCGYFKAESIRMENACDAMINDKKYDAEKLASKMKELLQTASEWKP